MRSTTQVPLALLTAFGLTAQAHAEAKDPLPSAPQGIRNQAAIDSALPAPTKPLLVLPPLCPGPGCPDGSGPTPEAQYERTLYLNFDGATITFGSDNATQNSSRILRFQSRVIPPIEVADLSESSAEGLTIQQVKDMVADAVRFHMLPYDVKVVTERPGSGSYHMMMFSGKDDCETIAGANCAGIAPLDCGDDNPSNIVWVFAGGLRVSDLSTTSSHEAAHALGVFHTLDTADIMYPSILSQIPDHFGAGDVPDGTNCQGLTFQDSDSLLLDTIGGSSPDTTSPDVLITQPSEGLTIGPGSMIEARLLDDGPVDQVEFWLNGELKRTLTREQQPFVYYLGPSFPAGPLNIRVVGRDLAGNTAETSVDVEFAKGGGIPCTTDEQCDNDRVCNGTICVAPDPSIGAMGSECAVNEDCNDELLCATLEGESRCTQTCESDDACPDGFECLGGTACWAASGGGGGGCATTGSGSGAMLGFLFFASLLGLGTRRRRSVRA